MKCRFCENELHHIFADLGVTPVANSYIPLEKAGDDEPKFPLCAYVCERCFLVQLNEFVPSEEIFSDYAYFSSYSDSWLAHCKQYTDMISEKLSLTAKSLVCEVASNDGYLLQYFHRRGIPVIGIEPAKNVAQEAIRKGIQTEIMFLKENTAREFTAKYGTADLLIANNVLAHVPNLKDFVKGLKTILGPGGVLTIEFPHLFELIKNNQFDTIYHEHFSYYSLYTCTQIFQAHDMRIFHVDTLPTHGGSLRIYVSHDSEENRAAYPQTAEYDSVMQSELENGVTDIETYSHFQNKVASVRKQLLGCIEKIKTDGGTIAAYGAPAKGNTLLNYCKLTDNDITFTVDRNPHKQNCLLPGSRIPVFSPEKLRDEKPDYIIILPWNLKEEIMTQIDFVRQWDARFIIPIPSLEIV